MMSMNPSTVPLVPQKQIEDLSALILLLENKDVIKERLEQLATQQANLETIRADSVKLLQTARQAHEDSLKAQEGLNHRRATLEAREEEVKRAEAAVKAREEAVGDVEKANAKTLEDGLAEIASAVTQFDAEQEEILANNRKMVADLDRQIDALKVRESAVAAEEARINKLRDDIEARKSDLNKMLNPVL